MTDALAAWRQNPLARRLVGMVTAYVVGNGITLRATDPALQAFLTTFWQVNRMDLRLTDWCDELTRAGEIFPILFTNPVDGMSQVRLAPAAQIERIEWQPGDYETELAYHERRLWDAEAQVWFSPWHERAADLATPLMLHYAVNRPIDALRGESDLAPILPWLRRYTRWLEQLKRGIGMFHVQNTDFQSDSHWGWPDQRGLFDVASFGQSIRQAGLGERPVFLEVFYPFEWTDAMVAENIRQSVEHCRAALDGVGA